jgi:hypothetical protein
MEPKRFIIALFVVAVLLLMAMFIGDGETFKAGNNVPGVGITPTRQDDDIPNDSNTPPVLTNADAYVDGDYVFFEVTYSDADGDWGTVELYFIENNEDSYEEMVPQDLDGDPTEGVVYETSLPRIELSMNTKFNFYAYDPTDDGFCLYKWGDEPFVLGDHVTEKELGGKGGDDDTDRMFDSWTDPEVIVGIIAILLAVGASVFAFWRTRRKKSRFSQLLEEIDDVHGSYHHHPHKYETEVEKLRAVVDEDLKKHTIDENNYNILKERLSEVSKEIRKEIVKSKMKDLPKDVELQIKDMLIDGRITRKEYKAFMKKLKDLDVSTLGSSKKAKDIIKTWMVEDEKRK